MGTLGISSQNILHLHQYRATGMSPKSQQWDKITFWWRSFCTKIFFVDRCALNQHWLYSFLHQSEDWKEITLLPNGVFVCGYLMFNQKRDPNPRHRGSAGCVMPCASQHASQNAASVCLLGSSLLSRVVCYFLLTSSPHQPQHLFNPTRRNFARSWVWCLRLLDDKINKGWRGRERNVLLDVAWVRR